MELNILTRKNRLIELLTNEYFILSIILAVALFLRLYKLDSKSLWYDEACSLNLAAYNWRDIFFHHNVLSPIPKPVFFILLKLWIGLFGYSEFAARSLSAIFGVLSVLLIYKIGKILFGNTVGLISAFILSISPYNIYYSQQVRFYSLFLFFSLLSMLLFLKMLKKSSGTICILYILTNILLLYTLPHGIYVLIIQNIFFIIFIRRKEKNRLWVKMWIRMLVVMFIVLLPIFTFPIIDSLYNNKPEEHFAISKPIPYSLVEAFEAFSYGGPRQGHAGVGFEINRFRLVVPRYMAILFCFLFALSIFFLPKNEEKTTSFIKYKDRIILLWIWAILVPLGFYLFSILVRPVYLIRYFIAVAPAFYIVIANVINRLKSLRVFLVFIIIILSIFSLNIMYNPGSNNDWRAIGVYARSHIKKGDIMVFAPTAQIIPFWYYYGRNKNGHLSNNIDSYGEKFYHRKRCLIFDGANIIVGVELINNEESIKKILPLVANTKNKIWLIISPYWIGEKASNSIHSILKEGRDIETKRYFDYEGVEVICFS